MTVVTRTRWRGALSLILAPLAIGLVSSPGFAKKARHGGNAEIAACVTNYKSGLDQEKSGHLLEARELFIRCSKSACGSPLREECTTRFTQLSVDIPSVVPVVTNAAGTPVIDVEVQLDGQRLTSSLDGHSFIMNPGPHDFSFSKDGHVFAAQRLMIVQGQRNRLIAASLQPPPSEEPSRAKKAKRIDAQSAPPIADAPAGDIADRAAPPLPAAIDPSSAKEPPAEAGGADLTARAEPTFKLGIPKLSLVTAAVGVAALGAGALLTYWGRKDTDLLAPCSPGCPQSSADHVHNLYVAADISIGVGVAALAGSYWAFAHSRSSHEEGEAGTATRSTPTVVLAPAPSGAVGAVSGSF